MAISYAHGPSAVPLLGETIGENLRRTVERFGDRDALVVGHQHYRATYRELWLEVDRAARGLLARGVGKGDRVGIWAPNRYEWVVTQFATARVGAILVTVNPAYKAAELAHALGTAGVSLLVMARGVPAGRLRRRCSPRSARACRSCATRSCSRTTGRRCSPSGADGRRRRAGRARGDAAVRRPDQRPVHLGHHGRAQGRHADAPQHPQQRLLHRARAAPTTSTTGCASRCRSTTRFGMVLGSLACATHGACMIIPGESFDATGVLETVATERCTSLYGVPTMFIAELEHPRFERFDLTSLRTGMMGGAPCPVDVMTRVRSRMHMQQVTIICGMTETSPVSTQTALDDPVDKRVQTVGRVHPHLEVKIVDPETGAIVPRGTAGEQCTRGYSVMRGYWNDAKATAAAIDAAGWMHSGDLAVMDDDGYLSIVGRIKDMIIRGGENVYPREIEEFLHGLPEIADVHVIGVPSQRYGEEVMAWVKLREGATLTDEGLIAACRGRIATYKIPRHWKLVDSFPMTITGKIRKFRMREIAIAELGLEPPARLAHEHLHDLRRDPQRAAPERPRSWRRLPSGMPRGTPPPGRDRRADRGGPSRPRTADHRLGSLSLTATARVRTSRSSGHVRVSPFPDMRPGAGPGQVALPLVVGCESGAAASEAPASRAQRGSGRAGVAGSAPSRREWAARMLCRFCGRARLWSGCFYLARRTRAARPRLGRGASCLADERARRKRARSVADAAPNVRRSAGPSDAIVSSTGMPAMCASGITGRSPWCSRRLGGAPRGRARGRWGGCGSRRRSRGRPASRRRASS